MKLFVLLYKGEEFSILNSWYVPKPTSFFVFFCFNDFKKKLQIYVALGKVRLGQNHRAIRDGGSCWWIRHNTTQWDITWRCNIFYKFQNTLKEDRITQRVYHDFKLMSKTDIPLQIPTQKNYRGSLRPILLDFIKYNPTWEHFANFLHPITAMFPISMTVEMIFRQQ